MTKKNSNEIKPAWIVCGMDCFPICGPDDQPKEFKSAAAAIKEAKNHVLNHKDDEAWIFRLSHVVERPKGEPVVDEVK